MYQKALSNAFALILSTSHNNFYTTEYVFLKQQQQQRHQLPNWNHKSLLYFWLTILSTLPVVSDIELVCCLSSWFGLYLFYFSNSLYEVALN